MTSWSRRPKSTTRRSFATSSTIPLNFAIEYKRTPYDNRANNLLILECLVERHENRSHETGLLDGPGGKRLRLTKMKIIFLPDGGDGPEANPEEEFMNDITESCPNRSEMIRQELRSRFSNRQDPAAPQSKKTLKLNI